MTDYKYNPDNVAVRPCRGCGTPKPINKWCTCPTDEEARREQEAIDISLSGFIFTIDGGVIRPDKKEYAKVLGKAPKWDAPVAYVFNFDITSGTRPDGYDRLKQALGEHLPCQSCDEGKGCRCGDE